MTAIYKDMNENERLANESKGQNVIFVIIIMCVLFLSYGSIPSHETDESTHGKVKKEAVAKVEVEIETDEHKTADTTVHATSDTTNVVEKKSEEIKDQKAKPDHETSEQVAKSGQIDIIAMNNPLYKSHKKGIVQFTHKKHVDDYSIACGSCHHDDKGKPLELTYDDEVESCIACHKETQKVKGEKLGKKEKIAKYHQEALHVNCIDCHKEFNIKNGDPKGKKPAPTSCGKCHPKNK
jgi:hypothetical protein